MARSKSFSIVFIVAIVLCTSAHPAEAYIDPGNTSMLLQLVVGGIAAGLVLGRRIWLSTVQRLTGALRGKSGSSSDPPSTRPLGR